MNTPRKRRRDTSNDCEIIGTSERKIRKFTPIIKDTIDLTSDDSNDGIQLNKINTYDKVYGVPNKSAMEKELNSEFPTDDANKQNFMSSKNDISSMGTESSKQKYASQDSAIIVDCSRIHSCETHFSESIDDLLLSDWDGDEDENDKVGKKEEKDKNPNSPKVHSITGKVLKVEPEELNENNIMQDPAVNSDDSQLNICETRFSDGFDELLNDDWDIDDDIGDGLDLSNYKRCKVTSITNKIRYIELIVSDLESTKTAYVLCTDNWRDLPLGIGELVIIKAKYSDVERKWVVNNEFGICVTQPDTLVSGTSVIQSLFCNRKGVLQQLYTGIDCLPNLNANDAALTCGSVTHQLFQTALQQKAKSMNDIWKLFDKILKLPSTILLLYCSDLSIKEFKEMVEEYIPQIYKFISRYIDGNEPEIIDENFTGKIETIRDIEESVWLPTLGLKGKIDVTLEVKIHEQHKILPLEIKTGRSSFSIEHKGQVYLYVMMMQMLGYDVSSGLLLYIKENLMHEITSTRNEQRDLLMMRNNMAYYLSREPEITEKSDDSQLKKIIKWKLPELPDPIHHASACKRCAFNTICCAYAKNDENLVLPDMHPHSKLQRTLLGDLTTDHIDYVIHWISLLQMESLHEKTTETNKSVFLLTPLEREKRRTCLSYMTIELPIVQKNDLFLHKFIRDPLEKCKHSFPVDDFCGVFSEDDYIMISTEIRLNIVSGCVAEISRDTVSLLFEKDITKWNSPPYYHLDEFPSSSLPYRALGTVAAMLANNDITRRLRRIIIDKEPATFTNPLPSALKVGIGEQIMSQLNYYQQEALKSVISATDFVLIKGMPGTGKTQTLVALIELLSYLGRSVLITAHTHMAVDNILQKLNNKNIDFLRLGSKHRIHPSLHHKTDSYLINECKTPEQLEAKYKKKNIVAVTCLGSHHALMAKRIFDYCLVDEGTQALQPLLLRPLYNANKFVLVGDPEQLPAVVRSNEARKLGMDEDLFTRLDSKINTRLLKQQYRMNETIMNLANRLTYKGKLLAGNEKIANATLQWQNPEIFESCEDWVKNTLSCGLKDSVVMLNTGTTYSLHMNLGSRGGESTRDDDSIRCSNYIEAAIIWRLVNVLISAGIKIDDIGVIAPYQAQLKLLKRLITADVEINTVDQYQGRDKSVILLSCTRTGDVDFKRRENEYEILRDHKRLNVALTRAKHKLIIVGDKLSLMRLEPFEKLFNILSREIIDLGEESCDFSSKNLINLVKKNNKNIILK